MRDPAEGNDGKEMSLASRAEHYQHATDKKNDAWFCHQCREWIWGVDFVSAFAQCQPLVSLTLTQVIAWRPSPPNATEPERDEPPHYKDALPRDYLVKWATRGFRHVHSVPARHRDCSLTLS